MTSVQEYYNQQWSSSSQDMFALAFQEAIAQSYFYLGDLKGKKLLEIGCGSGEQAVYFAMQGAEVTIVDISLESLKIAERLAVQKNTKLAAVQMNAEEMKFSTEEFDLIYINSVLMHVNQQKVLQECSRVLKKEGKLVIVEPLQYAPFVQIYRLLSSYRKMKPKYATLKMFKEGKEYFSDYHHKEFYLFSSALLPVFYLRNNFLQKMYVGIAKVDAALIKIFPFLRFGCWVSVVQYSK